MCLLASLLSCSSSDLAILEEGGKAPEIVDTLADGSSFQLSMLRGNVVLLDFWGSWCGPCHKEMPDIVKMHEVYSSKGLQVVSIALEKKPEIWKQVVDRYGMNWGLQIVRVSRYVRFDEIASSYGVTDIPAKFLIDEEGRFLLLDPTMSELKEALAEKYSE